MSKKQTAKEFLQSNYVSYWKEHPEINPLTNEGEYIETHLAIRYGNMREQEAIEKFKQEMFQSQKIYEFSIQGAKDLDILKLLMDQATERIKKK